MMGNIIKTGDVYVKTPFTVKYFNDDDGWKTLDVKPGNYKFRVLDVRGWKPRQLFIDGEWYDVMGDCKDLEDLLSSETEVNEITTVGNIAPTVDYMGHINLEILKGLKPVYPDNYIDKKDGKEKSKEDKEDSWVSPLGRLIQGESVRKVIGGQLGLFEE